MTYLHNRNITEIEDLNAAYEVLQYIFHYELIDYVDQCLENNWQLSDNNNPHIYAIAHKALGLKVTV